MATRQRPLIRWLAIALLLLGTPVLVFGATVAATGTMSVRVHEKGPGGSHLYLPMPALLFDVAAFAVPLVMPDDILADARRQLAPYRSSLRQLAHELESCPRGVLVEVQDGDEHVRVVKGWRSFDIEVTSDDADIRVSVPARLLGRSLDILG